MVMVDHMAQSNALREQPSMDEILASIRRIIDAGESQSKLPEAKPDKAEVPEISVTVPPPAANDEGAERPRVPQGALPQTPLTKRGQGPDTEIASAVNAYLEKEHVKAAAVEDEPTAKADVTLEGFPEPDISEVEAALRAEFNPVDRDVLSAERQAKYDARFTEADNGAFREVGSLLRGKVGEAPAGPSSREANALVSEAVSQSVSNSFSSLSDLLMEKHGRDLDMVAEEMLRPMLQEWLDNNLPSLVERLVRGEIERIARGEPRTM